MELIIGKRNLSISILIYNTQTLRLFCYGKKEMKRHSIAYIKGM